MRVGWARKAGADFMSTEFEVSVTQTVSLRRFQSRPMLNVSGHAN
jgi:hypothetical protein